MDSVALLANLACTAVSLILLINIWRRDVFFAAFFSMLVLYAVVPMWGYLLFPEISQVVLRMYFGPEALAPASAFTMLSFVALYAGYRHVYKPLTTSWHFRLGRARPLPGLFLLATLVLIGTLWLLYLGLRERLNYSNASDESFLATAGTDYKIFWQLYKFSTFWILALYALVRSNAIGPTFDRKVAKVLLCAHVALYVSITAAVGSRTDPLALALGFFAYEYYYRSYIRRASVGSPRAIRRRRWKLALSAIGLAACLVTLLSLLEASRGGGELTRDDVEVSAITQALLLKDYYWPFHVLIGGMSVDYVDPMAAIASNVGNSLMFIGVDYLQYFVVEQWASGTVTRTASPAMFAFTEGFVMMGWLGFLYNGLVWALGIGIWRLLSKSDNERFNALAFCFAIALAATVARSQSSYFIKDIYFWFIPALGLYAMAVGIRLPLSSRRRHQASPAG